MGAARMTAALFGVALLLVGCGDLAEFYEQPGRYPCQASEDCLGGFACGPLPEDPAVRVCQPACATHADCAGEALCNADGACVALRRDLCATVEGPLDEADAVLIGALTPQADYGDRERASVLAVREFNEAGGIAGNRKLVLVGCDDGGRPEQAQAAAKHLAALGAQAVVGPYFSGVYVETFSSVLREHGIFTISPSATSPVITGLEDDGLAWRTISSDQQQAAAMTALVTLRNPTHVLMLAKDDAYGNYLQGEVGGTLLEQLTVDGYRAETYTGVDADPAETAATALAPSKPLPDLIVIAGTSEVPELLAALEDEVARRGIPAPHYVLSEGAKGSELLALVAQRPALAGRLEGTDPSLINPAVYNGFAARYLAAFGSTPQTFTPNAYDTVYVIGHALSTTQGNHPGGAAIAAGVAQLIGGEARVSASPADIGAARMALSSGGRIELEGTSGTLDFDLTTGDTEGAVTGWTVEVRADGQARFVTIATFVLDESGQGQWVFDDGTMP